MKQINFICIALTGLIVGCNQPEQKNTEQVEVSKSPEVAQLHIAEDQMVVPGKKIGKIYLGQDIEEVFKILGKADAGDAAMGKSWSIWHIKDPKSQANSDISVYSSYKDSTMTSKDVKQIRVDAGSYVTEDGVKNNIDFSSIQRKLPSLKLTATYVKAIKNDTLFIYDAEDEGIAFDVKRVNNLLFSDAMTIHPKNESVNNTYLTIYPGWKKIQ